MAPLWLLLAAIAGGCNEPWVELDVGDEASWPRPLQWKTLSAPLNEIWTHDGQHLWAIGGHGFLLYSSDGGESWERRESGTSEDLLDIHGSADGQTLWILAASGRLVDNYRWIPASWGSGETIYPNGRVLHSSDGGATWNVWELPDAVLPSAELLSRQPLPAQLWGTPDGETLFITSGSGEIITRNAAEGWGVLPITDSWVAPVSIAGRRTTRGDQLWICERQERCWLSESPFTTWRPILPEPWWDSERQDRFLQLRGGDQPDELLALQGQGDGNLSLAVSEDLGRSWTTQQVTLEGEDLPSRQLRDDEEALSRRITRVFATGFGMDRSAGALWMTGHLQVHELKLGYTWWSQHSDGSGFQGIWRGSRNSAGLWDLRRFLPSGRPLGHYGETLYVETSLRTRSGEVAAVQAFGAKNPRLLRQGLPDAIAGVELLGEDEGGPSDLLVIGSEGSAWRSTDGGDRWAIVASPANPERVTTTTVSKDHATVWAAGEKILLRWDRESNRGHYWHLDNVGRLNQLCLSSADSVLWAINAPLPSDFGLAPALTRSEPATLVRSHDSGESWEPAPLPDVARLRAVRCGRRGPLVLDFEGAVWRLTEDGATWKRLSQVPKGQGVFLRDLAVEDDGSGEELWVAGSLGALFYSPDGGMSWLPRNTNLTDDLARINIGMGGHRLWLYLGPTQTLGHVQLLRSVDAGRRWNPTNRYVSAIAVSKTEDALWATGGKGTLFMAKASGQPYPQLTRVRLSKRLQGARLEVEVEPVAEPAEIQLQLFAGNANIASRGSLSSVALSPRFLTETGNRWALDFDPVAQPVDVQPGEDLYAELEVVTDGFKQAFLLPPLRYDPGAWWRANWGWVAATVLVGVLLFALGLLFWLRPLWLLAIARWRWVAALGKIPVPWLAFLVRSTGELSLVPFLTRRPRVLDAWAERALPTIRERFLDEEIVRLCSPYAALPVRLGEPETGEVVSKPGPSLVRRLFSAERAIVAVVGPGGIGKTSLAVAMACWAMDLPRPHGQGCGRMLPVLIDGETEDLAQVVRRKLRSWLDEELPEPFFQSLLKRKRLLVLVDRLSERNEATRRHLQSVHGTLSVGALLVTERHPLRFEAGVERRVWPQELSSDTLLFFITHLLRDRDQERVFRKLKDQLGLAKRLADLLEQGPSAASMTPLLVRIYVDEAIKQVVEADDDAQVAEQLSKLPGTIPEVYFRYLERLNPQEAGVENRLTHEQMFKAAEGLARLSVEGGTDEPTQPSARTNLGPHEFCRSAARETLEALGFDDPAELDPIERLKGNGVLMERPIAGDPLLRFQLDPIAEILAARSWARECGADAGRWRAAVQRIAAAGEQAGGLVTALRLVCAAFAGAYGWNCDEVLADVTPPSPAS